MLPIKSYIWMPGVGLLVLIASWRWWVRELIIPKTLGRWFLASCYMVPIGALFFIGIAIDLKKLPSVPGWLFIIVFLAGLWFLTGFSTVIFGPFRAIESRKVRKNYALQHGLKYQEQQIEKHLLPDITGLFSSRLSNVLYITADAYIATTLRYLSDRDSDINIVRGYDYVTINNVPMLGVILAVQEGYRKSSYDKKKDEWEFQGRTFRIAFAEDICKESKKAEEHSSLLPLAIQITESVLRMIVEGTPDILHTLKRLYLFSGRITLELDYLDTEQKLSSWVHCAKRLVRWSPPFF